MNCSFLIRLFSVLILLLCGSLCAISQNNAKLILPDVPTSLTQPGERAEYIITNYWDNLDFRDSVNTEFMEQAFVDYLSLFEHVDSAIITKSIDILYSKSSVNSRNVKLLTDLAEQYLYEVDSPMFNEGYFRLFLDAILKRTPDDTRAAFMMAECWKNQIGSIGADFEFNTVDDQSVTLHGVGKTAKYKLLIFFDPDCVHCRQILKWLSVDDRLKKLNDNGAIAVVTVYTLDEVPGWKQYASTLPQRWINGYSPNGQVDTDEVYSLKATPSIYLLSGDNVVLGRYLGAVDIDKFLEKASSNN